MSLGDGVKEFSQKKPLIQHLNDALQQDLIVSGDKKISKKDSETYLKKTTEIIKALVLAKSATERKEKVGRIFEKSFDSITDSQIMDLSLLTKSNVNTKAFISELFLEVRSEERVTIDDLVSRYDSFIIESKKQRTTSDSLNEEDLEKEMLDEVDENPEQFNHKLNFNDLPKELILVGMICILLVAGFMRYLKNRKRKEKPAENVEMSFSTEPSSVF